MTRSVGSFALAAVLLLVGAGVTAHYVGGESAELTGLPDTASLPATVAIPEAAGLRMDEAFAMVGAHMQAAAERSDAAVIVATIDGEPVTVQDLLDRLALLQGNAVLAGARHNAVDLMLSDALERVIAGKVQVAEARRRGIIVTGAEVKAYAQAQRELVTQAPPETRRIFEAELAGRGLSEAQFWEQEEPRYEIALLIGKLSEQVMAEHRLSGGQGYEVYEQFVAKLVAAAEVRVLEPAYVAGDHIAYFSKELGFSFAYSAHIGSPHADGGPDAALLFHFVGGEFSVSRSERPVDRGLEEIAAESIAANEAASSGRLRQTNLGSTVLGGHSAWAVYSSFDSSAGRTDGFLYIVHTEKDEYRVACQTKPGPLVQDWDDIKEICDDLLATLVFVP